MSENITHMVVAIDMVVESGTIVTDSFPIVF